MQDLLLKAITNLSFFIWTHELLPLDILLLALIDRDDDPYALRLVVSPLKTIHFASRISKIMFHYKFCSQF
jgi:mediator of RNA polymerase II transcription subunit 23